MNLHDFNAIKTQIPLYPSIFMANKNMFYGNKYHKLTALPYVFIYKIQTIFCE